MANGIDNGAGGEEAEKTLRDGDIGLWPYAKPGIDCGRAKFGTGVFESEESSRCLFTALSPPSLFAASFFRCGLNQQCFFSLAHFAQGPAVGLSTSPRSHFTFRSRQGSHA